MQRIPEPELMDEAGQVLAYAQADFAASDAAMVERLLAWQDAPRDDPFPDSPESLRVQAATDAVLGALRSARDEEAARLMRAMALADGAPPTAHMRDARFGQAPPRTTTWSP
jgi:hypothetical protein